ncbi:hypothetical protein AVEN_186034-1 [Araneus ventricosus]|uniref:Reverse transcriptase domain-containing protein n=1 Tax=Araneus ventricosus TaxID=182803 RepID=A0A4Y2ME47_ARAVE|nr:hypothetical protein AVEN_186034-1 [Araneus ventricosus]
MLETFHLLSQKIIALLLPVPSLTNSPPQFLGVKHNGIPIGFRWSGVQFRKLIDNILIHPQFHGLGQRHNLVDNRLHRYCFKPSKAAFDNASSK